MAITKACLKRFVTAKSPLFLHNNLLISTPLTRVQYLNGYLPIFLPPDNEQTFYTSPSELTQLLLYITQVHLIIVYRLQMCILHVIYYLQMCIFYVVYCLQMCILSSFIQSNYNQDIRRVVTRLYWPLAT